MSNFGRNFPSDRTSCMCSCGCFLIAMEAHCPICGASNPVYGNKSLTEEEAEYDDQYDTEDGF